MAPMFGWFSDARMRASRSNRTNRSGSAAISVRDLDRDLAAEPCVGGSINLAHAARRRAVFPPDTAQAVRRPCSRDHRRGIRQSLRRPAHRAPSGGPPRPASIPPDAGHLDRSHTPRGRRTTAPVGSRTRAASNTAATRSHSLLMTVRTFAQAPLCAQRENRATTTTPAYFPPLSRTVVEIVRWRRSGPLGLLQLRDS